MSELVDFLTARLDEDEAAANRRFDNWRKDGGVLDLVDIPGPARVLAEVNAKRAVVDMLADAEAVIARIGPDLDKPGDAAEWANYHAWRQAVEALAQPFRGEPGWRDEWGTQ